MPTIQELLSSMSPFEQFIFQLNNLPSSLVSPAGTAIGSNFHLGTTTGTSGSTGIAPQIDAGGNFLPSGEGGLDTGGSGGGIVDFILDIVTGGGDSDGFSTQEGGGLGLPEDLLDLFLPNPNGYGEEGGIGMGGGGGKATAEATATGGEATATGGEATATGGSVGDIINQIAAPDFGPLADLFGGAGAMDPLRYAEGMAEILPDLQFGGPESKSAAESSASIGDIINQIAAPDLSPLAYFGENVIGGLERTVGQALGLPGELISILTGGLSKAVEKIFGEGGLRLPDTTVRTGDTDVDVPVRVDPTQTTEVGGQQTEIGPTTQTVNVAGADLPGALQGIFDPLKQILTRQTGLIEGLFGGQNSLLQGILGGGDLFGGIAGVIDAIRGPEEAPAPQPLTSMEQLLTSLIPNVFGGEPFQSSLRDFAFDPQQLSALEQQLTSDILDQTDIAGQIAGGQNLLSSLFPTIQGGGMTGMPQDTMDLYSQYASTLAEPLFAQAAERAPGGVASSGYLAESGNIAQRLAGEGAKAQIAANEAARGRQLDFLSGAPSFVGATTALPLGGLQDVFGLGQTGRDINLGMAGQPLQTLLSLGGMSDPGAFYQAKFLPGGSSLGDLFRGLGGFGNDDEKTTERWGST